MHKMELFRKRYENHRIAQPGPRIQGVQRAPADNHRTEIPEVQPGHRHHPVSLVTGLNVFSFRASLPRFTGKTMPVIARSWQELQKAAKSFRHRWRNASPCIAKCYLLHSEMLALAQRSASPCKRNTNPRERNANPCKGNLYPRERNASPCKRNASPCIAKC